MANAYVLTFERGDGKVDQIINRVSVITGQKRMTIPDLARAAEISPYTARQYWYGVVRRPDLEVVAKICRALDCQVGDIFVFMSNGHEKNGDA